MSTISLIKSAFGRSATLYTVLNCTKSSTQPELRLAYKKAALRFHPDRAKDQSSNNEETTLKFQAVSAAYQVLMDETQRATYDATGQVIEEHDDISSSDDEGEIHNQVPRERCNRKSKNNTNQQQWEDFFHSIFNEILSTGCKHEQDAQSYARSDQERNDVLKYYTMCKGDVNKILECIVHASKNDIDRWRKEIIGPAIQRGEVDDYANNICATKWTNSSKKKLTMTMTLEDSSSSDDEVIATSKRLKRGRSISKKNLTLVDTDDEGDEEDETIEQSKKCTFESDACPTSMSMREKMDYRVAKKRKIKAEKEMEFAKIVQSKNWDAKNHFYTSQQQKKSRGVVSDNILSTIEKKYGNKSSAKSRKKR